MAPGNALTSKNTRVFQEPHVSPAEAGLPKKCGDQTVWRTDRQKERRQRSDPFKPACLHRRQNEIKQRLMNHNISITSAQAWKNMLDRYLRFAHTPTQINK